MVTDLGTKTSIVSVETPVTVVRVGVFMSSLVMVVTTISL